MSEDPQSFREQVRQIVQEAFAELRPEPVPLSTSQAGAGALPPAGGEPGNAVEVTVRPSGEVSVRVSPAGGAAPDAVPEEAPVERGLESFRCIGFSRSAPRPCIGFAKQRGVPEPMEAPAFSVEEESLLARLMREQSLSRDQLLGHLFYRLLAAEARRYAAELEGSGAGPSVGEEGEPTEPPA